LIFWGKRFGRLSVPIKGMDEMSVWLDDGTNLGARWDERGRTGRGGLNGCIMHRVHTILHINAYPGSERNGYTLVTINRIGRLQHAMWQINNNYLGVKMLITRGVNIKCECKFIGVRSLLFLRKSKCKNSHTPCDLCMFKFVLCFMGERHSQMSPHYLGMSSPWAYTLHIINLWSYNST
jgi:hypothetical protein